MNYFIVYVMITAGANISIFVNYFMYTSRHTWA